MWLYIHLGSGGSLTWQKLCDPNLSTLLEMARVMCAVAAFMFAAAVVQAAASEAPHATKTNGEKTARQLGKASLTDPSSLLTELEKMVHSGETPAFELLAKE